MVAVARQDVRSDSRVPKWYAGRSVLVTGATGFLGMVTVEKLLRSCPDIGTIYMLVRPKRGRDPQERLEEYVSSVLFSKLRGERPDFARQLSVVAGDLSSPDFRLAEQDMAALQRDVSVVFHCAASVRFNDSLRQAVNTNVVGTKRVLQLAEQLPNLQVFLYISTSFCHSDHQVVEEKLYPPKADPEKIMNIVSSMDDDLLEIITPKLLGNLPNTYAFTKNLTEELVARYSDRLPIVIARPSIVVSIWKEPLEGWTANMNGPLGFLIAVGKGVMRVVMADLDIASDLIPVDCTVNAIIIVAWHVAVTRQPNPYVCNITNGRQNYITWRSVMKTLLRINATDVTLRPVLWYCAPIVTTSVVWYTICHFFLEVLPAHILDFFIRLCGRKPFLVHVKNRLHSAKIMLRYYVVHEWTFINKNITSLHASMAPEDQEVFYFNVDEVDQYDFCKKGIIGAKRYLLNESLDNIPSDLRYMRRMYLLHVIVRTLFYGLLLWLLYSWSEPALEIVETAMEYLSSLLHGAPVIRALTDHVPVSSTVLPGDEANVTNN
ncbi:fatty acyl-CoA reductase 1-like isoform X1 [Schistocerca serialis cubense]|uniref:fatty acyl-CoA reductase 1-like isoform X1 n=1 Tax=Schistocerca serialis cubense TaxID=2023355 RepID=UPI00214F2A1A|nr:fatty acyl-CoA reductase 1-like isoform X1 [Schistocerca serialis cubense]XP_049941597.1 fatty acyl-CoA reductase 1-like isoform X1 [Schistocerca serialis cubense]